MATINIPNNATNEDVLKLVFPNWEEEVSTNGESIVLERFTPYCKMQLHKDWLDKPYTKGKNPFREKLRLTEQESNFLNTGITQC